MSHFVASVENGCILAVRMDKQAFIQTRSVSDKTIAPESHGEIAIPAPAVVAAGPCRSRWTKWPGCAILHVAENALVDIGEIRSIGFRVSAESFGTILGNIGEDKAGLVNMLAWPVSRLSTGLRSGRGGF